MIRAKLNAEDGTVFLLGVDAENVRRLTAGQPISIDMAEIGGEGRLVIYYGETLEKIAKELELPMDAIPRNLRGH